MSKQYILQMRDRRDVGEDDWMDDTDQPDENLGSPEQALAWLDSELKRWPPLIDAWEFRVIARTEEIICTRCGEKSIH